MSPIRALTRLLLPSVLALTLAACGGSENPGPDAQTMCMPSASAPTYAMLYTRFFAPNSTGHCANDNCHGEVGFNVWKCGANKDTCFQGMVTEGLINPSNPLASKIADRKLSPLTWVNTDGNGFMPADGPAQSTEGRDAILAWVSACAPNN